MHLPLRQRASNTDRTFSCHGSMLAVPRVPPREDDDGVEGSAVHYEIASRAVTELGALPPDGGLIRPPDIPKHYKIPAFSTWIPDWALRHVREEIPADWALMVEAEFVERIELARPVWVPVTEILGEIPPEFQVRAGPVKEVLIDHFYLTGHADLVGQSPDGRQIKGIDWKTGIVGADPAENSWQAATYLGLIKLAWPDTDDAEFIMAQPKIDEDATGIPRISRTRHTGAALDTILAELAEQMNAALEDRHTTNDGPKQCRYCPVGRRCPSIKAESMKAKLTAEKLDDLMKPEKEDELADFVIAGRVLAAPFKAATEAMHAILDDKGAVTSSSGATLSCTTRPGPIKVPDPVAYDRKLRIVLPEDDARAVCYRPSKDRVIDQIAKIRGIHKKSKKDEVDATSIYNAHLAPLTVQEDVRILVITQ